MSQEISKAWWKSKTLWFNVAIGVGTVLEAHIGLLSEQLGPNRYLGVMCLIAAANIVLRYVTTQPVK